MHQGLHPAQLTDIDPVPRHLMAITIFRYPDSASDSDYPAAHMYTVFISCKLKFNGVMWGELDVEVLRRGRNSGCLYGSFVDFI
jgi:hypothetical protein